jgi:hypothetical protein
VRKSFEMFLWWPWVWAADELLAVVGREPGPLWEEEDEGRCVLYCWCEGGNDRDLASWRVTIRSPGLTVDVGWASPGLVEVEVGTVPSLATSVAVEAWALVLGVIVEVEEDRDSLDEGVPRWVSLSSVMMGGDC